MSSAPHPPQLNYVSAPCGSGKTYSTCTYIRQNCYSRNQLYVAPTLALLKETRNTLEEMGVSVDLITTESSPSVKREIIEYLEGPSCKGQVLLISYSAYLHLPFFPRRENWEIFIDEVPSVDQFYALDLHQNREFLSEWVDVEEAVTDNLFTVKPRNVRRIQRLLENPDDITKQFQNFLRDLINPSTDVFVDYRSWRKFEDGVVSSNKDSNRVHFITMVNPAIFEGTTIVGANFEDSLFSEWMARYHNVQFTEHVQILEDLRYSKHPSTIGGRLRISYLLPDKGHSKFLMNQSLEGKEMTWGESIDQEVIKHFNGDRFLYAANNDYQGVLLDLPNAERIPVVSNGLNQYSNEVNFYFGPALNRSPQHLRMLYELGLSSLQIKTSTVHEAAYQALMRTSLRDPNSTENVNVVVPEYETAKRLVEIFGQAEIKFIGCDSYRKVKPLTGAQRNRRLQFFKRKDSLIGFKQFNEKLGGDCLPLLDQFSFLPRISDISLIEISKENCHGIAAKSTYPFIPLFGQWDSSEGGDVCITFHADIYDKHADLFEPIHMELQEFIQLLKESAGTVIDNKDELFLFNPSQFQLIDKDGFRRQNNFKRSSMMVLDFDGGEVSIENFEDIFWNNAGKAKKSFVICNSFSRSTDDPNHFRVFLFYKKSIHSIELHKAIYDNVIRRLESHGFSAEMSGLDFNCRNGIQSFYIPCTNRRHPSSAYFKKFGTQTREIQRYAIDPELVERTMQPSTEKVQLVYADDDSIYFDGGRSKEQQIALILDGVRTLEKGRHTPFYIAALKLKHMRLKEDEIQYHLENLEEEIGKKSQKWAHFAMKSLKNSSEYAVHF